MKHLDVQEQQYFVKSPVAPIEARSSQGSRACYERHTHKEYSIGIIEAGKAEFFLAGQVVEITPGSVVSIGPDVVHSCNPMLTSWSYKMLYIDPAWLVRVATEGGLQITEALLASLPTHSCNVQLYRCFQVLFAELTSGSKLELIKQLIAQLIELLLAESKSKSNTNAEPAVIGNNIGSDLDWRLIEARGLIVKRSDSGESGIKISELAESVSMSQFQLIRAFRLKFGMTPHAFQISQRVCKGRKLLAQGLDISSVAAYTGFSDQSHFHRNFKKLVAATPKRYRDDVMGC